MKTKWNKYKKITLMLILYACTLYMLFWQVILIALVTSGSMEPTVVTGDVDVSCRLAYIVSKPQRGDIITFNSLEKNTLMGKRIIGVAGDHIEFHDGYVYINGEQLDESAYLYKDTETNCAATFDVPEGCVFVLGDNRENSNDSRFWENPYISISDIEAKFLFVIPVSKLMNLLP